MRTYTVATRRSELALAQCRAYLARHAGVSFSELHVVTTGDRIQDRALSEVGGKGLFVKEIEESLLELRADLAVHSMKDVPASLVSGLVVGGIPAREDARDALVSPKFGTLSALPRGARVGTSSLRRRVALLRVRPDLEVLSLRGNVDTRLRKVDAGDYDAVVLAAAGLGRLGRSERITELLSPEVCLPAVGQGALAIECRADDSEVLALLDAQHDDETARCVSAERGVLFALSGDCRTPIAAHATRREGMLTLRAWIAEPDGSSFREGERCVPYPETEAQAFEMGRLLGGSLLEKRS